MILPRVINPIGKYSCLERNPPSMRLRILPPQNTPHYHIHANQMAIKNHPDRENWSRRCIQPHPRKHMDFINISFHCGQPCPPMPLLTFQNNFRTGRVHYSDQICNWSGWWSPQRQVGWCYRTPVIPQKTTRGVVIPLRTRPTSPLIQTSSWHQS